MELKKKILWTGIFAIAMGFLEAIVVVYARELYYPNGFAFPLVRIPEKLYLIELLRELSTLVMLLSIGILLDKRPLHRFSWFLFAFGIWDIFYYVALWLLLGWPESILTWDILFLIPITWLSPVLAPVICSLTMIVFALFIFNLNQEKLPGRFWLLFIGGSAIIFISFIYNYTELLINEGYFSRNGPPLSGALNAEEIISYVPDKFRWGMFVTGEVLLIISMTIYIPFGKKNN